MMECKHGVLPVGSLTCPRCETEGIESPYWRRVPLYRFVTAKLNGKDDCRQGWLISYNPLQIQGQSGEVYECEGRPLEVADQPTEKVIHMRNYSNCLICGTDIGLGNDPAVCQRKVCREMFAVEMTFLNFFAEKERSAN